jgi:hypothetical protein
VEDAGSVFEGVGEAELAAAYGGEVAAGVDAVFAGDVDDARKRVGGVRETGEERGGGMGFDVAEGEVVIEAGAAAAAIGEEFA